MELLEGGQERLLKRRTLGGERLEDLTVEVKDCMTQEVMSVRDEHVKRGPSVECRAGSWHESVEARRLGH